MATHEYRPVGFTDADAAALASITANVERIHADMARLQAGLLRELAKAEELACRHTTGEPRTSRATDMAHRSLAAELGTPLHITDRTMQQRMGDAFEVVTSYPATLEALENGRISQRHVNLILEFGHPLPAEARAQFEAQALPRCESDTVGRVRAGLKVLAERLHPRTLTQRHVEAREQRSIILTPLDDGMCELNATLPLTLGEGIYDRLTQQAAALQDLRAQARDRARTGGEAATAGDETLASDRRTMDQLRADIFADMLLTAQPGADPTRTDDGPGTLGTIRARVQVVVPALTLTGASEHPADLAGRGPIDADTARRLAGGSCTGWDRLLTHPVSGQVLATDRYQPTPDLRRRLRARDAHCRFPGCRVPAIRCEHDHTVDFARGGKTRLENLEGLCQRHHSMKQFTAWKVTQLGDGALAWTSPLGRFYVDEPPVPTVHFVPDDAFGDPAEPPPPWTGEASDDPDDPPPWEDSAPFEPPLSWAPAA